MTNPFSRIFLCFLLLRGTIIFSCTCPPTELSLAECNKYEIIFRGTILSLHDCGDKFGEAIFEVQELYKGNATKEFKVLFECGLPCAQKFSPGEEWIIYSLYKQIDNAKMDWCSRSRKFFKVETQDFYKINYGNDYDDEINFLRKNLGQHRLLAANKNEVQDRNKKPDSGQMVILLIISMAGIVLFYWLFNKFFR